MPSHQIQSPVWSLRKGCWNFAPFSNPGYASDGAVLGAGAMMMRMPGPGGVLVILGGRMTRMLGPGLPGGSGGGCGGLRGRCFSGLIWGGCAPLPSPSLG